MPREGRGASRINETRGLRGFIDVERARLFDGASPERRAQLRAAERSRDVYTAWNAVCQGTREGVHVTGLHYVPERNELVVYLDAPAWTQEMTMLREIIRARMAALGVELDGFVFRTSREGHRAPSPRAPRPTPPRPPAPSPLDPEDAARIDEQVSAIGDSKLRESLGNAMKASLAWKKGARRLPEAIEGI
ncbi:MAG: DUF721 domain-containing protein [Collinsella sp.]|nr:DUF721 domain-containing protein [Collinsella sp.]